jgi:hypothetical protein
MEKGGLRAENLALTSDGLHRRVGSEILMGQIRAALPQCRGTVEPMSVEIPQRIPAPTAPEIDTSENWHNL